MTRLWYVNPVRPKEMLLTGMTRDGTFLIEDGEITRPLADVRFTDSALRLLDDTEALTRRRAWRATASSTAAASPTECSARRSAPGAMRFTG